jgi:4-amino-4-deoxy-L-arabinose transferase-like glycosyltransferase
VRRPALFLLFLCVLTFFVGLGRAAITDADEAYYAESAREMVERGDWLTPYFNYEFRWQKPVLYYWLTAITYLVFGIGEWSARCWSALAGIGLVFVTYQTGRRITRYEDVGWLAGAIVATSYGYFALARMALPDLPLAFFVTVTIGAAFEGRWVVAGLAAGLGFLVKGPIAVLLPGIVWVPVWWRERERVRVDWRDLALSGLVFAVVALPWYAAMTMTHGTAYLESFFVGDNLERFATDRFNEPRSVFFYVPILIGGLLPWSAYLVVVLWRPVRDLFSRRLVLTDAEWRLLLWAGMPLLFFSISVGKQPRYILPVLPPVAIFLARAILLRLDAARTGQRASLRDLKAATVITSGVFVLTALLLWRARELFINAHPALTWAGIGVLLGCATALAIVALPRHLPRLPLVMPACAAVMLLTMQFGALSGRRPEAVEEMAALVQQHRAGDERVGQFHVFVRNLVFYAGFRQEHLPSEESAVDFMRSGDRVLLVVRDTDLHRLESKAGVRMQPLGDVRYVNTAGLRLSDLLIPRPEITVERILLVANR